jgi:hypothetical protein
MAVDRRDANMVMIKKAEETQAASKEAIFRIDRQLAETEEIGAQTLEELRKQGSQMDDINSDLDKVSTKLDQSASLQTTFDKWAGNWWGGKKKAALEEAAAEIANRDTEALSKVKEVFEHETYSSMSRSWKPSEFVLCNAPTVTVPDIFQKTGGENWMIDYSLSGIDAEGWTYAYDFATLNKTGAGEPKPAWNSYVRRRKWRFQQKKSAASENAAMNEVRERNQARMDKLKPKTGGASQADKIGYVPRAQQAKMAQSGLTNTRMGGVKADEELDEDSAAGLAQLKANDAEIDQGMDRISSALDRIGNIASAMGQETRSHTDKLERVNEAMTKTADKTTVVNARQKHLLR